MSSAVAHSGLGGTSGEVRRLVGIFLLAATVSLAGTRLGPVLAGFWPMWQPGAPGPALADLALLHVGLPLVGMCAAVFLLWPGLMLALALLKPGRFEEWLLAGFAVSMLLITVAAGVAGAALGWAGVSARPLEGVGFALLVTVLGMVALSVLWQADRKGRVDWGLFAGRRRDMLVMLGVPLAMLAMLAPKFAIEGVNGDGAHALLAARLLVETNVPFWPPGSGEVGSYPSITAMLEVFPNSWFVRLFGPHALSARLLYAQALALLAGVLLALIRPSSEHRNAGITRAIPALGIAGALLLYSFVLAYNTSYDPYFADVAMPMAREPLIVLVFLGFTLFVQRGRYGLAAGFAVMTHLAVPSGLLLMGFWLAADFVVSRPLPWSRALRGLGLVVFALVLGVLVSRGVELSGLAQMSTEFGAGSLAQRVRFLTFDNPERVLWWALPCGVFPALSLLAWRWHSQAGRTMALVCLAYAAFFSLQAYRILPHHFAPLMVLPLITFWTMRPLSLHAPDTTARSGNGRERLAGGLTLAGLLVGALLCWPPRLGPNLLSQQFATRIEIEGPRQFDIPTLAAFQTLFETAFPFEWAEGASDRLYFASSLSWYTYATGTEAEGKAIDYRMQPAGGTAPWPEAVLLASAPGWDLFARSVAQARQDRVRAGLPVSIAPLFRPARGVLFGPGGYVETRRVFDLARLARLLK